MEFCTTVEPIEKVHYLKDDPDDDKVLECAVGADCNYIVSGDKHLIRLKSFKGIKILSPAEFLVLIR